VRDLSLEVEPGEFLVMLGPSGCGKTTALRMVAGLESADSGSIHLGETDMTHVLPKYRDIAMVFQSYALYPHKTVAQNIGFPLKVRGVEKSTRDKAVRDAAAQVRMETLLERYPRQLSGGQRQRVALARAVIRRPAAFLMDEPLSNLDAKLRGFMRTELKHMQHELGVTTIYVTHDQIEAMTLAHRVAIIEKGVLQQLGTPREVYNSPANMFVAGFMGSPPMNFVEGKVENGRFKSLGIDIPVSGKLTSDSVTLGFRPEDTEVVNEGKGLFDAKVYAAELMGEQTLVTVRLGETMMAIKMPKDYDIGYDVAVGVQFAPDHGFLFDTQSGGRLNAHIINKVGS
jgi:multiple sugar transport system ATP-binding protein